jgi:hypothetical protein
MCPNVLLFFVFSGKSAADNEKGGHPDAKPQAELQVEEEEGQQRHDGTRRHGSRPRLARHDEADGQEWIPRLLIRQPPGPVGHVPLHVQHQHARGLDAPRGFVRATAAPRVHAHGWHGRPRFGHLVTAVAELERPRAHLVQRHGRLALLGTLGLFVNRHRRCCHHTGTSTNRRRSPGEGR